MRDILHTAILLAVAVTLTHVLKVKVRKNDETGPKSIDPMYDNMVAWLKKGGVQFTGVTGRSTEAGGGRGLFATKEIQEAELLFKIPHTFWFSEYTIYRGSAVSNILEHDAVVRKHCPRGTSLALIVALDYERHNQWSPWRAYIDGLPTPTSPVWWSHSQVKYESSFVLAMRIGKGSTVLRMMKASTKRLM